MGKKVIEIPTSLGVEFRKNISEYSDDFLQRKYDASGISSLRRVIKEELNRRKNLKKTGGLIDKPLGPGGKKKKVKKKNEKKR